MLRRLFQKDRPLPDLLPAEAFHGPIHAVLDARLSRLGFVCSKPGTWAKEDCREGRPMIVMQHYKGKMSAPVWGYSLNYVPHLNNACSRVAWHRTLKSARLDVFPFDEQQDLPSLSRFATAEEHVVAADRILGDACDRAERFFATFSTAGDLLPLFNRLRDYDGDGLGYWNYTNLPLAHAFTLRLTGDERAGRRLLERYIERHAIVGRAAADLDKRFADASLESQLL